MEAKNAPVGLGKNIQQLLTKLYETFLTLANETKLDNCSQKLQQLVKSPFRENPSSRYCVELNLAEATDRSGPELGTCGIFWFFKNGSTDFFQTYSR